ncbi:MAG: cupin domain-containing protein [Treponema sp.]|nr:cupin domain-containing protein [Treponema sp.]
MPRKFYTVSVILLVFLLIFTACADSQNRQPSSPADSDDVPESPDGASSELISESNETESAMPDDGLAFPLGDRIAENGNSAGNMYMYAMIAHEDVYNLPEMNNITFEPMSRYSWHSHEAGEILLVTGGVGYYQEEGKPAQIVRRGDSVTVEADVRHWHGAAPENWFAHVEISVDPARTGVEWADAVPDETYAGLGAEEYAGRTVSTDNAFMFQRSAEPMGGGLTDYFSGPVYLSSVLDRDNPLNPPSMSYVVFAPGTVNNWHTHGGGQVLIATDGIGYHQLQGRPVEVLHPGDVAFCPPNETHWHGGSADVWFAHIAIGTNPGNGGGTEWLDRISEEEYAALPKE